MKGDIKVVYHCLFEQSGTFKNEFKKLGYEAYDYDILDDFRQTDFKVDLFNEIEKAYGGGDSIFDTFSPDDEAIAFFPCTRFDNQINLNFRGENYGMRDWDTTRKLRYDLKLHQELSRNYEVITKLAMIAFEKNIKLIIENPYSEEHYLRRYWCIKPLIIDYDRRDRGDHYKKPTQYFFLNRKPSNNLLFEGVEIKKSKRVSYTRNQVERSMISSDYANRFIREFIL